MGFRAKFNQAMDLCTSPKMISMIGNSVSLLVLLSLTTLISQNVYAVDTICQSASADIDGDGWGWENGTSCIVEGTALPSIDHTQCLYLASDDDNDGWGWESNASCRIGPQSSAGNPVSDGPAYVPIISENGKPACQFADSDPDNDGYGWENGTTCVVTGSVAAEVKASSDQTFCSAAAIDPDNDGWGWENGASCIVLAQDTDTTEDADTDTTEDTDTDTTEDTDSNTTEDTDSNTTEDTDTDTTEDTDTDTTEDTDSNTTEDTDTDTTEDTDTDTTEDTDTDTTEDTDTDTTEDTDTDTTEDTDTATVDEEFLPADITDLILVTGQSNALGAGTKVDNTLDAPHPRVLAYTREGWKMAQLHQSWDNGAHPGTGSPDDNFHNNLALHFGKRLAELDANTVVGFVLMSEPGEGIEHWLPGNIGMQMTKHKTIAAINELPHKSSIDGILWHQGETDWQLEGTSDPDVAQPAAIDYYPIALANLIGNLRSENWYNASLPFICGETILAVGVNTHLSALNTDADSKTACIKAEGLPAIREGGSHFNAASLRLIGQRYAEKYFELR